MKLYAMFLIILNKGNIYNVNRKVLALNPVTKNSIKIEAVGYFIEYAVFLWPSSR